MEKIKKCPYCNSKDVECENYGYTNTWHTFCNQCEVSGPDKEGQKEAIKAWNQLAHYRDLLLEVYNLDYGYNNGDEMVMNADEWDNTLSRIARIFER